MTPQTSVRYLLNAWMTFLFAAPALPMFVRLIRTLWHIPVPVVWRMAMLVVLLSGGSSVSAAEEPDHSAALAEARQHLQKGRIEEAIEAFQSLVETKADPAVVAVGLSRCHEAEGKWPEASAVLESALKHHPKAASLWSRLAEIQLAQGRFDDTLKSLEQALQLAPDLPAARLTRARLYTETGKLKEADEDYRWFVKLYNRLQPKDAETLLVIAQGSVQYARWHSVPQVFNFVVNTLCPDALADDKSYWQAYQLSGSLLLEKFNREQGLPDLREALTINPRAAEVLASLADASLQELNLTEAMQFADRALEINPRLVNALQIKADLKMNDGDAAGAMEFLQQALAVNPHDQLTLARVAACYVLEDGPPVPAELEEVLTHLDAVKEVNLDKPSRLCSLILELAKRNPHPGVFLNALGESLEGHKKFELAELLFKTAIKTMPQLAEPKTALGMLYMRVGKSEEAAKILDKAFEADPYHVRVSNMRKVVKLLKDYEVITTDHFVIRVDSKADKLLGKYMAEYLEQEYPALVKQFGFEPPQRTQFEIFSKSKGLSAHEWFSARMVGLPWIQTIGASTGMIVALASPTSGEQQFNWARVVKHEFVHILTLQQTQFNIPHWFTEALAVTSEGTPRPAIWNQLLLERVPKGELMNLDTLDLGFKRPKTPLDWQMAYCQSKLYADYMQEQFGAESVSKLLNAYRDSSSTDRAIPLVFGVTKEKFEEGYLEYIRKITQGLQGGKSEPVLTLAEVEKEYLADTENSQAAARFAYELWKAKQLKEARKLAKQVLEKNPREPLAAVVLAQLELRGEDVPSAMEYLTDALDRENLNPVLIELLAKLQIQEQNYAEAAELYELAHKQNPTNIAWVKGMALTALKLDKVPELKRALELLAQMDSDDAAVRKKLAAISLENKTYEDAVRYAKLALQVDVQDPEVHRVLAEAQMGLRQFSQAVEEFGAAVELKPDDEDLKMGWARARIAAGQTEPARTLLNEILKRDPENSNATQLLKSLK